MPTWVFGGDCKPTLARLVVEDIGNRFRAGSESSTLPAWLPGIVERLMHEPGDTVVTRSSLLGRRTPEVAAPHGVERVAAIARTLFICEHHQQLTGNAGFQANLLDALFSVDVDEA